MSRSASAWRNQSAERPFMAGRIAWSQVGGTRSWTQLGEYQFAIRGRRLLRREQAPAVHLLGLWNLDQLQQGWNDVCQQASLTQAPAAKPLRDEHAGDRIGRVGGVRASRLGVEHLLAISVVGRNDSRSPSRQDRGDD